MPPVGNVGTYRYIPGRLWAYRGMREPERISGKAVVTWIARAAPVVSEMISVETLPAPIAPAAWSIPPLITRVSGLKPSISAVAVDR